MINTIVYIGMISTKYRPWPGSLSGATLGKTTLNSLKMELIRTC